MSYYDFSDKHYEERAALEKRRRTAMGKLLPLSLSRFTVSDFIDLLNIVRPSYDMQTFEGRDADVLDQLVQKL